MNYFQGQQT